MYLSRETARKDNIRSRFPRVGPLVLRITGEPQSSTSWKKGASGERRVGQRLDAVAEDGVITLHDRRVPGTRGNIDHIAIGPSGIYVVDSKKYKGRIERRTVGGLFKRDLRLYIGGRDRTPLAEKVGAQATVVKDALRGEFPDVRIRPVLCFVDPEVGMFTRPFDFRGITITWPRALQKQVSAEGPLDEEQVHAVATWLAAALPPA